MSMISIPFEFMIYIISGLIAIGISITYYLFDLKRTNEETEVRKNSLTGQQITNLRRHK
tara:strand:- start:10022 stop:10198 length:177 start_codon:yes stop_codon:yes gene_type:complete